MIDSIKTKQDLVKILNIDEYKQILEWLDILTEDVGIYEEPIVIDGQELCLINWGGGNISIFPYNVDREKKI